MAKFHDLIDHEIEDFLKLGVFRGESLAEHKCANHVRDRHVHLEPQVDRSAHPFGASRRPRLVAQEFDELCQFVERCVLGALVAEPEVAQRVQRKASLLDPQWTL